MRKIWNIERIWTKATKTGKISDSNNQQLDEHFAAFSLIVSNMVSKE